MLRISHVVTVPDTHQMTVLDELAKVGEPRLLTVCTEDEGVAINMGLYISGQRPALLVQNRGLYASMNSLLGLALDGGVPTFMLVGQLLRDVAIPADESLVRAVYLAERTLDAWQIPYKRLERESDLNQIRDAYEIAQATRGPAVVLVGAPTI
jgi:sulfopyruvate decarboxylase subunit alpha